MSVKLSDLFRRLDDWYAEHTPQLYRDLRPGITEKRLAAYEAGLGVPLPEEVRAVPLARQRRRRFHRVFPQPALPV